MKKPENQEIVVIFVGIFLLLIGIILNEYVLTSIFSEDGILQTPTRLKIWLFDIFFIGLGLLISLSKSIKSVILKFIAISDVKIGSKALCDLVFTVIILLLFITQFSYLANSLSYNTDNQGVIFSTDPDAGNCIGIAKKSHWFGDNGHDGYGPVYFRVAKSIAKFSFISSAPNKGSQEFSEERIHLSLIFISLISLYGISAVIAQLLVQNIIFRLLCVLLINASFLDSPMWTNYLFRARVDLLLSVLASLFLFFLYRSKVESSERFLYLGAFVGGTALSTKMPFLFFLPSLVFLEIPPFSKDRILRLIKFFLLIALSYFAVGFHQNFYVDRNISFLLGQSRMSVQPTLESFFGWWVQLLQQGLLPLIMILILFLFFGKSPRENRGEKYLYMRLWAVAFVPFIFLLTRKVISSHVHYTLPFVSILLTAVAISLPSLTWSWIVRIKTWFKKDLIKYTTAMIMLVSVEMTIGIIPENVGNVLNGVMGGREDVKAAYQAINSYADDGNKILLEAYIPYQHGHKNIEHGGHLKVTLDKFKKYEPDIVAVNVNQMPRIMEGERPNDYMIITRENYQEIREYYGLFYNRSQTVDQWGRDWVVIYENAMGVQLWEKK